MATPDNASQQQRSSSGRLGFNGQLPESTTRHYLLGNGYRAYNPALMRFNQPDSWSPFGAGGLNPYQYCLGDPINHQDPAGHAAQGREDSMDTSSWVGISLVLGMAMLGVVFGVSKYSSYSYRPWVSVPLRALRRQPVPTPAIVANPPDPLPSTSGPTTSSHRRTNPEPQNRPKKAGKYDAALSKAVRDLDSDSFIEYAKKPGVGAAARRALNSHLPYPDLRDRAAGDSKFLAKDFNNYRVKVITTQPNSVIDEKLLPFLDAVEPVVKRSNGGGARAAVRRSQRVRQS